MNNFYDTFMEKYAIKHELCPRCGTKEHSETFMGCILDIEYPEEYRDLNICTCCGCGSNHVAHDRISEEEFKNKCFKELACFGGN